MFMPISEDYLTWPDARLSQSPFSCLGVVEKTTCGKSSLMPAGWGFNRSSIISEKIQGLINFQVLDFVLNALPLFTYVADM